MISEIISYFYKITNYNYRILIGLVLMLFKQKNGQTQSNTEY